MERNMRISRLSHLKNLGIIIIFTLFLLFPISKTWASESAQEIVEANDIPKLLAEDPAARPPVEKLVPNPTPEQDQPALNDQPHDTRSWTKFKHKDIIQKVAEKYNLDPQVIYATVMTESEGEEGAFRYEPHIKDASLCMGQILISTARQLGFDGDPRKMYKPEVCLDLVGKYHRRMLDTYGQLTPVQLAVAYNTGSPYKRPVKGHLFRFNKWLNEEG